MKPMSDQELYNAVHVGLKNWSKKKSEPGLLADFKLYQTLRRNGTKSAQQCRNELLACGLDELQRENPKYALLLTRRFIDKEPVYKIANGLGWAESTLYRKQSEAITHLARILCRLDATSSIEQKRTLLQRLEEPTYTKLIGIEPHLSKLTVELLRDGPPWIIGVEGMGGVGKTSLADALARHFIEAEEMTGIGWVTARTKRLTLTGRVEELIDPLISTDSLLKSLADQILNSSTNNDSTHPRPLDELLINLEETLKAAPYIIFIDNLETIAEVDSLLPRLRTLINPTKFVLTTRKVLHDEADIFHYGIPELSYADSLALIRQEGISRNLPNINRATDEELKPIWQTVGGNPLALRLVVGQTHIHALNQVLAGFTNAQGNKSENLYTYIYRRVWDNLDEQSRLVLLAMPLVAPSGGDLNAIHKILQMDEGQISSALENLVALNLVDSRGGLNQKTFTIHNLTRSFLQKQVAKWQ